MKLNDIQYKILYFLMLYMPFHYYICELLLSKSGIDNVLRDLVIIFLFMLYLVNNDGKIVINKISSVIFLNIITLLVFAIISYGINGYSNIFNILRTYIVPMLIYFPCSKIKFSSESYLKFFKALIIEAVIIGLYGIFQAFVLGDSFLVRIGYESLNGHLASSSMYLNSWGWFQRSVGTFVSPNQFGLYLEIILCILIFSKFDFKFKNKKIVLMLIVISILGTFSRSTFLAIIVALIIYRLMIGKFIRISKKSIMSFLGVVIIGFITIYFIDFKYNNGDFTAMLNHSVVSIFNKTDASSSAHLKDLYEPIKTVLKSPLWGLGFGNNGPLALASSSTALAVESSFYLMMYEEGIILGLIFFVPYFLVIKKGIEKKNKGYIVPCFVCLSVLVTYLLLPNCQTFEIPFYSYVFIGFASNESLNQLYINNSREKKYEKDNISYEC